MKIKRKWRRYCAVYSRRTFGDFKWKIVELNNPGLGLHTRYTWSWYSSREKAKETARKWNEVCFGNSIGKEIDK